MSAKKIPESIKRVRPILTYATETRAETLTIKRTMPLTKMKILRNIREVTFTDKIFKTLEKKYRIMVRWRTCKRFWSDHDERLQGES